jgi:integrase
VEIRDGVHVADSASATVKAAGDLWVYSAENAGLERTTTESYSLHLRQHIVPFIGQTKLSALSVASVRAFEDALREAGRSPAMVRKILVSLGSLLGDAQERGLVARNVVRDMRGRRKGTERRQEKRQKGRLKVGVDIPTRAEIKAIVEALDGRWRPLLMTAIFSGLRASELRGLRWGDVDFAVREIRVHQRADRFNKIGPPKSVSGERSVPVPPLVVNTLREWRLACPKGDLDLVFPNGSGNVEQLNNIVRRGLKPAQVAAGVTVDGKAKYPGIHALRHFFASWCINRVQDGGLGLPAKVVQGRLGHSSIVMTLDVYGHLFPRGDDADELAAAERSLLG